MPRKAGGPDNSLRVDTGLWRRRWCRVVSVVTLPTALLFIWHGIALINRLTSYHNFSSDRLLSVTVRSCDVDIFPCAECDATTGRIHVVRPLLGASQVVQYAFETSLVDAASVESTVACDGVAFSCAARCHVNIYAPAGTADVRIQQAPGDAARRIVITVHSAVHLGTFKASGHAAMIVVEHATISSRLDLASGRETIQVIASDVQSAKLYAATNNVYLVTPEADRAVSLIDYRSASNYGCFATNATISFGLPWDHCQLATSPWSYHAVSLRKHYDPGYTWKVTAEDLVRGMEDLGLCCGPSCPFASKCHSTEAYTYIPYGTSYTTFSGFLDMIIEENATNLVPFCHRRATIDAGSESSRTYQLTSDSGAIYFAQGGTPLPNATSWSLTEGRVASELRILRASAQLIMTEVRDVYAQGVTSSDEEVFIVFDVVAAPGVPRARFVYTNQPVYLTLPPALTRIISFGLLAPKVKHYLLHFASQGCDDNDLPVDPTAFLRDDASYADMEDRLLQIGNQIYQALLPYPRNAIWGSLARINESESLLGHNVWSVVRDMSSGRAQFMPRRSQPLALAAFWISLIVAMISAFQCLWTLEVVGGTLLRRSHQQRELKRRLKNVRSIDATGGAADGVGHRSRVTAPPAAAAAAPVAQQLDAPAVAEQNRRTGSGEGSDEPAADPLEEGLEAVEATALLFSPLRQPVELIDSSLVAPVRRALIDSLKAFVTQRCRLHVSRKGFGEELKKRAFWIDPRRAIRALNTLTLRADAHDLTDSSARTVWQRVGLGKKMKIQDVSKGHGYEYRFTWMADFRRRYEQFCFDRNLACIDDVVQLRRRLIEDYGVLPNAKYTAHVFGVQWVRSRPFLSPEFDFGIMAREISQDETMRERIDEITDDNYITKLMELFVACGLFVIRTQDYDDFVHYEDKNGPGAESGPGQLGLESVFIRFCESMGYDHVGDDLAAHHARVPAGEHLLDDALQSNGLIRRPVTTEELQNLCFVDLENTRARLGYQFYAVQFVTVLIHLCVLLGPMCLLVAIFLQWQTFHSTTMDPSAHAVVYSQVSSPIDFLTVLTLSTSRLSPALVVSCYILIFLAILLVLCLLFRYLGCTASSIHTIFLLTIRVPLWLLTVLIGLCCQWILLGAVLKPDRLLPGATAVVTFVVILVWQSKHLYRRADKLRGLVRAQYQQTLHASIKRLEKANRELRAMQDDARRRERRRKSLGGAGPNAPESRVRNRGGGAAHNKKTVEADHSEKTLVFEPGRLFDILDADGSGWLSKSEFYRMFAILDLQVPRSKQQVMFCYADGASGSVDNRIDRNEFIASWEWLEQSMASAMAESLGLGESQIAMIVALLGFVLAAVLVFILIAITAFNTTGGFAAVVQSAIISGSGILSQRLIRKPKGDELAEFAPKELEELVKVGIDKSKQ